jgi:hypothetical protein
MKTRLCRCCAGSWLGYNRLDLDILRQKALCRTGELDLDIAIYMHYFS